MKNGHIHKGLEKEEIRNFLGMAMVKNLETEFKNKKIDPPPYNQTEPLVWVIKDLENDIAWKQRTLSAYKERAAILEMLKLNGWEEFDLSDETIKGDLPYTEGQSYTLKMSFIGTEEEYKKIKKKITAEQ